MDRLLRYGCALVFLAVGTLSVVAQVSSAVPSLTEEQYEQLKIAGQLPAHFTWAGSVAKPAKDVKPDHPGVAKGGGGNLCDCWVQPDNTWTLAMPPNDDQSSSVINLPFSFNLYGNLFSVCYINNNGNVSFDAPYTSFSSNPFPSANFVMVAPFWADVMTTTAGQVWYKLTNTALYVDWVGVGYFNAHNDKLNTFSLVITDGNDPAIGIGKNVSFCYHDMQWTTGDASGGSNGFGGTPATVGANLGNGVDFIQFGRFDHPGTDYDGPFGNPDGVSWLDYQHFAFNTEVFTNNIPPIGVGDYLCDTVHVCAGEQVTLEMQFLSPESNQITTATSSAPSFSNYTETVNTPGQTAYVTGVFTPLPSEAGFHMVTFQATDNGTPPLTSTYNIVVEVDIAASMEPGALTVCDDGAAVDMYTLIGGTPLPGGTWTDPNGQAHSGIFQPGGDITGDYVYSVGSGGNCPNTGVVTMSEVAHVDAGTTAGAAYCTSDDQDDLFLHLGGTPQNGGHWLTPGGAAFSGTLHPGSDASGAYSYVLNGTDPCPNDTARVNVTIQQAVDPGQSATITLCADAAPLIMLNALNGDPQATGTWTAPGGAAFAGSFHAATDLAGTYTYTVNAVAPCPTLSSTLAIAVDPLPDAGQDADLVLCADAPMASLFASLGGSPDTGGHWLQPDGGSHTGMLDPSLQVSGPYTYVVQGPGTCVHLTDTAVVAVVVNPLPVISFTVEPDSGCNPLRVTFTNTTDPVYVGNSCVWDLGDGAANEQQCGSFQHLYQDAGWYNVKLTVTTPQGCTDHLVQQGAVLVEPAPHADFGWTPDQGTEFNSNLLFSALDPHAVEFRWYLEGQPLSTERQFYHEFPHVLGDDYQVCLRVADRYGCADTLCEQVHVIVPALYVPTCFTPNGDGINDIFLPIMHDMVPDEHELLIFDRWGELIFDGRDAAKGWDGRHSGGGDIVPEGVYTWRLIERPADTSDKKDWFGTVTLLK